MSTELFAAVLAGGKSSRMGRDKRFLVWNQEFLVDRAVRLAAEVCGQEKDQVYLCGEVPGRVHLTDAVVGIGPLGGLLAAVRQVRSVSSVQGPWLLVLPVDMPFLDHGVLMDLVVQLRIENKNESLAIGYQNFEMPFVLRCNASSEKILEKICFESPPSFRSIRAYLETLGVFRIPSWEKQEKLHSNLNFQSDWEKISQGVCNEYQS